MSRCPDVGFWWRIRRAGGLIFTTLQAGQLPNLCECRTSPDLLAGIAAELLGVERDTTRERAGALFFKHRGYLRNASLDLYDLVAQQHDLTKAVWASKSDSFQLLHN